MQTDNPILDGMAKLITNAAGAAHAFRAEMETIVKGRMERLIAELDFVPREEFQAVKAMAAKARAENGKLAARVAELEARLGIEPPGEKAPARGKGARAGHKSSAR